MSYAAAPSRWRRRGCAHLAGRVAGALLGLVALLAPVVAQGQATAAEDAASSAPPAASTGRATSPEPGDSTDPQDRAQATAEARSAVATAEALFASGNYEAAVAEFERAYELMGTDSRRHAILNNIAVTHERAFRYGQALHYYHRYLDEADPDEADRAEVQAVVRTLENLLGTVQIQVAGAPELWIDGRRIGACPRAIRLPAGPRVIELRAPGYEPQRREITVSARQTVTLRFALTPISDLGGLPPQFFYAGVGLTAAAAVTSAVLGALLVSKRSTAETFAEEGGNLRTADALDRQAELEDLERFGDWSLGATAVLGTATVVLLVMTNWGLPGDAADEAGAPLVAAPIPLPGGGGLALRGAL